MELMAEPLPYLKLENSVIFWFRRDLRLDDNHALYKALNESSSVIPIFIYDSDIVDKININDCLLYTSPSPRDS